MGKKSGPSAPDFKGAAQEQAQASREVTEQQTWANRPDQINPWGNVTWDNETYYDPATKQNLNRWTQRESLTPEAQAAFDSQLALTQGRSELGEHMMGRIGNELGQGMNWDQVGGQQGLDFDPSQLRQRAEDNAFKQATSRLAPKFQGQREQMEIKLRNQGLRAGDQAYEAEMAGIGQQETDAYGQAQMSAMQQGRAESGQLFGQQKGMADYANQLRQNAMKEEQQRRGFSLNEANALISGQQVQNPTFESFQGANRAQAPNYLGAAQSQYGANVDQYNAGQAAQQGLMSGIGTGASKFMMCDRRLKQNIKQIGLWRGYPLYSFTYAWGEPAIGPMSDEINQDAVFKHSSGFDCIHLARVQ